MTAWRMVVTQGQLRAGQDAAHHRRGRRRVVHRGADRQALRRARHRDVFERRQARAGACARRRRRHQLFDEQGLGQGRSSRPAASAASIWSSRTSARPPGRTRSARVARAAGGWSPAARRRARSARPMIPLRVLEAGAHHRLDHGQPEGVRRRHARCSSPGACRPSSTRWCRSRTAPPRSARLARASSSARLYSRCSRMPRLILVAALVLLGTSTERGAPRLERLRREQGADPHRHHQGSRLRASHGSIRLQTPDKTWIVVLAPPSRMENRGLRRDMLAPRHPGDRGRISQSHRP